MRMELQSSRFYKSVAVKNKIQYPMDLIRNYDNLRQAIKQFKDSQAQFVSQEDSTEKEILQTNRIIKKEVIDIAEMMENTNKVLILMNNKIDRLEAKLD